MINFVWFIIITIIIVINLICKTVMVGLRFIQYFMYHNILLFQILFEYFI